MRNKKLRKCSRWRNRRVKMIELISDMMEEQPCIDFKMLFIFPFIIFYMLLIIFHVLLLKLICHYSSLFIKYILLILLLNLVTTKHLQKKCDNLRFNSHFIVKIVYIYEHFFSLNFLSGSLIWHYILSVSPDIEHKPGTNSNSIIKY